MGLISRILGIGSGPGVELATADANNPALERRSAPTSWDLIRGDAWPTESGSPVSPHIAENLSAVFACVQAISETLATLPLVVYRRTSDGVKSVANDHPVARLFRQPNELQTPPEFIEMMQAHCLLRGNAFALIERDNRGAPTSLIPLHPGCVSVLCIAGTAGAQRRIVYEYSDPNTGGTERYLPEEILHLRDRSDDGIIGKSRLQRARETFGTASATERFAAFTYKNGATMSGVLSHPGMLSENAAQRIKNTFDFRHTGVEYAKSTLVLEEGLKWEAISVSPEDAQMLESRRFGVEQIARLYRVPPPVIGDLTHGTYSNVEQLGRWFFTHCISPWLVKWERTIERALFSEDGRRNYVVEFDADLLLRADMLTRFQAYRIGREVGLYSANDLRRFESLNPRTDPDADAFLSPLNMQSEQTGQPKVAA